MLVATHSWARTKCLKFRIMAEFEGGLSKGALRGV